MFFAILPRSVTRCSSETRHLPENPTGATGARGKALLPYRGQSRRDSKVQEVYIDSECPIRKVAPRFLKGRCFWLSLPGFPAISPH
jgi:hypothetical protein